MRRVRARRRVRSAPRVRRPSPARPPVKPVQRVSLTSLEASVVSRVHQVPTPPLEPSPASVVPTVTGPPPPPPPAPCVRPAPSLSDSRAACLVRRVCTRLRVCLCAFPVLQDSRPPVARRRAMHAACEEKFVFLPFAWRMPNLN